MHLHLLNQIQQLSANNSADKTTTKYVATGGQTIFAAVYELRYVDVYLNGVKLTDDLYDATSGTLIILNEAAAAGDIIEIVAFKFTNVSATRNTETLTIGSIASELLQLYCYITKNWCYDFN